MCKLVGQLGLARRNQGQFFFFLIRAGGRVRDWWWYRKPWISNLYLPFKKALACPTGPLGEIEPVQYAYSISMSFSGTLETTIAQLNSTSGMPLLGQPSFCLKVTSSLVLFLFQNPRWLNCKKMFAANCCSSCGLYTAVVLSLILSCLSLLSFHVV